jgi:hypothetical protein
MFVYQAYYYDGQVVENQVFSNYAAAREWMNRVWEEIKANHTLYEDDVCEDYNDPPNQEIPADEPTDGGDLLWKWKWNDMALGFSITRRLVHETA